MSPQPSDSEHALNGGTRPTDNFSPRSCEIPAQYLHGTKKEEETGPAHPNQPENAKSEEMFRFPFIMFINCQSGGRIGSKLADMFAEVVGGDQVFDLSKDRPDKVLKKLYENLERGVQEGDHWAGHVKNNLRILACGGDGTVAWIVTAVKELNIHPAPPTAVIPLGTGNGVSINFGWGKTIRPQWLKSPEAMTQVRNLCGIVHQELKAIVDSVPRKVDIWKMDCSSPSVHFDEEDSPACMHLADSERKQGGEMGGQFIYYWTFGVDAETAWKFQQLRDNHPKLTAKRKANIFWYLEKTFASGWFCGAHPLRKQLSSLKVRRKENAEWETIELHRNIFAIVCISLQSYSGGRDLWGLHDSRGMVQRPEEVEKGFTKPIFDDGLLEVIGLKSGWHTFTVLSQVNKRVHGVRLAQAHEILAEFIDPNSEGRPAYMRLDGEPWAQNLDGASPQQPLEVRISHAGQGKMLLNTQALPGANKRALSLAERQMTESKPDE